ncbi:hypothetical protein [Spirosoma arcticum]
MNKTLLTLLAIGLTTVSFGQKAFILSHQEKKGFFAVSAGGSQPVGRFASCSPVDDQAGMAGAGTVISLSAGYRLVGPVGLMVRGEQHRNAIRTHALLDGLYRNETDTWTASADAWAMTTIMGGPYLIIPLGRFTLDTRLLAGRASAVLPNTHMSGNFGTVDMWVETTGSRSEATALGGGLSLRYRLGRSLSLHLNSDYTRARFMFDNLTTTAQSNNGRSERAGYSSSRTVSVVSVSAGVALLFGNSHRPF